MGERIMDNSFKIIEKVQEMQNFSKKLALSGKTIALVPTMGFLHNGHIALIRKAKELCDKIIVSIFVNPAQFGKNEDFKTYPKKVEKDCDILRKEKVDILFTPKPDEIYPDYYETYVFLKNLPNYLCGKSRPSHFQGVATIVTKLFNIVKPDAAIFGEKDFQQLVIIKKMNVDLNFGINIVGVPTVREPDGLAMSSRNTYLTKNQRTAALSLFNALKTAQKMVKNGEKNTSLIIEKAVEIITIFSENSIDYISICDPYTLKNIKIIENNALMATAVKVGGTRLIDNAILTAL
jgi:pantoate--beta-alanine ligase